MCLAIVLALRRPTENSEKEEVGGGGGGGGPNDGTTTETHWSSILLDPRSLPSIIDPRPSSFSSSVILLLDGRSSILDFPPVFDPRPSSSSIIDLILDRHRSSTLDPAAVSSARGRQSEPAHPRCKGIVVSAIIVIAMSRRV